MGGRGSSSGAKGGAAGRNAFFSNVPVEGVPSSSSRAQEVLHGVHDVLSDFGLESSLSRIRYSNEVQLQRKDRNALAGVNGFNQLTISNNYLKSENRETGYTVTGSFYGTGAHEAGHIVAYTLLKNKVMPDGSPIQQATARSNGKLEKAVIREATKRYGSNPKISEYGSTSFAEKVAEAVSDVYTNKAKANPYSRVIVQVLKDTQSGDFKPKINYNSGIKRY